MSATVMPRTRLDAIAFDAGTQIRAGISEQVVAEYSERMSEGVTFPPIVLFHDGTTHYMADGFHRYLASQRVGFADIAADVRAGTKQDALWFALGANKANGHRLTPQDKRHAIEIALRTWPEMSGNRLATQLGVNQSTVQRVRDEVMRVHNLPGRVTGKDGKSYPASRSTAVSPKAPEVEQPKFKSRAAVEQRSDRMRMMAADGHTSPQIAQALGLSVDRCRVRMRELQIDVPADRAVGRSFRHDSTRIVSQMVMDAENLTADVNLIVFADLDREQLGGWIDSLIASRRSLNAFVSRLIKEQQKHGEAA